MDCSRTKKIEKAIQREAEETAGIRAPRSVLNRTAMRDLILRRLGVVRPAMAHKLTRVSDSSYRFLEYKLERIIDDQLSRHTTVGSTVDLRH